MADFWSALRDPDLAFLGLALVTGLAASVSFGIMGSYVVARRITYLAGAIAHSVLGGIGAALFLQYRAGWTWFHPMLGAVVAALAAAMIIGWVSLRAREREDTVIGAIWATGMAAGLLLLAKTPGYLDPMSYLFGNILMVSRGDLWSVVGLDVLVVALSGFFYNQFLAVCFDEEFARLRGVRVEAFYLLLLLLTALTVVLMVRVVGIVMVIALLTLPAAVAEHFSRRIWHMVALAIVFCALFVTLGLGISYVHNLPSGPTIILVAALAYLVVLLGKRLRR